MSRELLLSRVGDHLNIIGQDRELAASTLLKWIVARLKFDQSIRINGIGVFQLKKEPLPRVDRRAVADDEPVNKRTLIYAPVYDEMSKKIEAAFVSFDLDELKIDSSDYLDKVFSLNIDKPLIPIQDSSSSEFVSKVFSSDHQETLEEKIEKMVNEGETLQDYNIFENYMNSDDTVNAPDEIEEDDIVKEELLKTIGNDLNENNNDENHEADSEPNSQELNIENQQPAAESEVEESIIEDQQPGAESVEEDIVIGDEEEVAKGDDKLEIKPFEAEIVIGDKEIAREPVEEKKIIEEQEPEGVIVDELEPGKDDEETSGDISESIISADETPDEPENKKEDLFAKLENYLNEDNNEEQKQDPDLNSEEEGDEEMNSTEEDIEHKSSADIVIRIKSFFTKPGFIVSIIIASLLAILIFVFRGSDEPGSEASSISNEVVTETQTDPDQTEIIEQTEDSLNVINNQQQTVVARTGLYRDIPNDFQTANQIYFDGSKCTVQVSSWKNQTIAESEIKRLRL